MTGTPLVLVVEPDRDYGEVDGRPLCGALKADPVTRCRILSLLEMVLEE